MDTTVLSDLLRAPQPSNLSPSSSIVSLQEVADGIEKAIYFRDAGRELYPVTAII